MINVNGYPRLLGYLCWVSLSKLKIEGCETNASMARSMLLLITFAL